MSRDAALTELVKVARRGELPAGALEPLFDALWHTLERLPWSVHGLPLHEEIRQALEDLEPPLLALLDALPLAERPGGGDVTEVARLRAEAARERAQDMNQG